MKLSAVFQVLPGPWRLIRDIPGQGTMSGIASFSSLPDSNQLAYREEGEAVLNKHTFPFFRDYVYSCEEEALVIYFREAPLRVYHRLEWTDGICKAEHLCGGDRYTGTYDFRTIKQGKWNICCVVLGPNKNYTITTVFTRETPC